MPFGLPQDTFGVKMLANTLLRWGTEEQRSHFLPRILSGEDTWCQGYSEPDAGSDLASLTTRAVREGDEWVIDGQKVWTSGAHHSDWIFVLARTDRDAPKHRGISFLLVPLDQPGVEVRPFRMMSGQLHFNEVFFDGARTRADLVVGGVDNGWTVAQSLLGVERGEEAATNPILFRAEVERLVELARLYGRDQDPVIRQRIAWCWSKVEVMRYLGYRILTGWLKGAEPGPESSIAKLFWSEYHTKVTDLAMDIMGLHGQAAARPPAVAHLPHRRPGRRELLGVLVDDVPDRPLRHDLRGHLAGAAEHPRGEGAGAAARAEAHESVGRSKASSRGTGRGPVPGRQPASSLRSPTPSGAQMWQLFSTPAVARGPFAGSPASRRRALADMAACTTAGPSTRASSWRWEQPRTPRNRSWTARLYPAVTPRPIRLSKTGVMNGHSACGNVSMSASAATIVMSARRTRTASTIRWMSATSGSAHGRSSRSSASTEISSPPGSWWAVTVMVRRCSGSSARLTTRPPPTRHGLSQPGELRLPPLDEAAHALAVVGGAFRRGQ